MKHGSPSGPGAWFQKLPIASGASGHRTVTRAVRNSANSRIVVCVPRISRIRSLNYLKATLKQIHDKKPSPIDGLKVELDQAVEEEDYERAARLRDRIRAIEP